LIFCWRQSIDLLGAILNNPSRNVTLIFHPRYRRHIEHLYRPGKRPTNGHFGRFLPPARVLGMRWQAASIFYPRLTAERARNADNNVSAQEGQYNGWQATVRMR
jgi:hypothetical protein